MGTVLALLGLALLAYRLTPRAAAWRRPITTEPKKWPLVSIIVPARDEAANLPRLLGSLKSLDFPATEIIVVDDCSTDDTAKVAEREGARVIRGRALPEKWRGKQWACWQGAYHAQGDLFLFTDADTDHAPDSLKRAVQDLVGSGASMLSAMPYHEAKDLWERLLGPFHLLLLAMTAPFGRPRKGRVFAIGQYLLLTRQAYRALGGHSAVRDRAVEDLPLANHCLQQKQPYRLYPTQAGEAPLYRVRMYASFGGFLAGWRRNFRAGFTETTPLAGLEMILFAAAITGGGEFTASLVTALVMLGTMVVFAYRQRAIGNFHVAGAVLAPFVLVVFCYVSALAFFDLVLKRKLAWKGRAYAVAARSV